MKHKTSKRKQKLPNKKSKVVAQAMVILALACIAYVIFYYFSSISNQILRSSQVQSVSNGLYHITSASCISSQYLMNASKIKLLCTEVVGQNSNLSAPDSIVISKYIFADSSSASDFLSTISYNLDATPWPSDVKVQTRQNATVLYASVSASSQEQIAMRVIYMAKNNVLVSVAGTRTGSNATSFNAFDGYINSFANLVLPN